LRCSHKVGGYGLLWRSDERGVSGFTIFGSGGPGDGIFLEEGEKVVDGDGGAERAVVERGVRAACGRQRERRWAQPAAIDEAGDLTRVGKENGRAALTFLDFMSEKEEIGFGKIFFFAGLYDAEDLGRGKILHGNFVGGGVANVGGMKRSGEDGVAGSGTRGRKRQESNIEFSVEGIGRGAEDGDIVRPVNCDDVGFESLRRSVGTVDENVGLAEIAEGFEDVGRGDEIALRIDEEGVAEKSVANAFGAGSFVVGIDDGADGGAESGVGWGRRRVLGSCV